MNPPIPNAFWRAFPRVVVVATIVSVVASVLALTASVAAAPQAAAAGNESTDPSVARVFECERGGATIEVFIDNLGQPRRRFNVKIGWKTAPGYLPADTKVAQKYFGIPDGEVDVSYTFGDEEKTASLVVDCKEELGMPHADIELGCASTSGFAKFHLINPTGRSVEFTVDALGRTPLEPGERIIDKITVPARQDRTINFLNLPDHEYRIEVKTPDDPDQSFYWPLKGSNYLTSSTRLDCSKQKPSVAPAERNHVVIVGCQKPSGPTASLYVITGRTVKPMTVELGQWNVRGFSAKPYAADQLIAGVKSGVYDIAVRVGTTNATFEDMPVDCDSGTYVSAVDTGSARAEIKTSCLAENGRVDALVYNDTSSTKTFYLNFPRLARRSRTVPPGGSDRMTITGRRDGNYTVTVTDETGQELARNTETVECDPPLVPVRVKNSCLAGNGRVDVYLGNTTGLTRPFEVEVGTIVRQQSVAAGKSQRVTVTGRRDGPLVVNVKRSGQRIHSEVVRIACD